MRQARILLGMMVAYTLLPFGLMLLMGGQTGIGELLYAPQFLQSMTNSLALGLVSTFIALFLSLIVLSFLPENFRKRVYLGALILGVVPPFLLSMGISKAVFALHLAEGFWLLSVAHAIPIFPYMLFFTFLGMGKVPLNMKLSAQLYSGSATVRFVRFYLPFMKPALLAGILLGLTVSFSQYVMNLMLWQEVTLTSAMVPYIYSGEFGKAALYGMVFVLNLPLMVYFAQKLLKVN